VPIFFLHEEQFGIDFPPYLVIRVSFLKWRVEGSLYKPLYIHEGDMRYLPRGGDFIINVDVIKKLRHTFSLHKSIFWIDFPPPSTL
jgi:hypothetical protein